MASCRQVLNALAETFQCAVCFHDYDGRIIPAAGKFPLFHLNPFCERVRVKRNGFLLCCDMEAKLSREEVQRLRRPFCKCCHAGVWEMVVPIFDGDRVTGVMFIGPFRKLALKGEVGLIQGASQFAGANRKLVEALPELSVRQTQNLAIMAELAAGRIAAEFGRRPENDAVLPYGQRIKAFIDGEFRRELYIGDLAAHLSLSEIRVCQLLRQELGKTFPELLNRRRVEHAQYLLKDSLMKMEWIAAECGFHDPAYFQRIFKGITGMTPGAYRRQVQAGGLSASSLLA